MEVHYYSDKVLMINLAFKRYSLFMSLLILGLLYMYSKFIDKKVKLLLDLRACPELGYYRLCSSNLRSRIIDCGKEWMQQQLMNMADAIYISRPELRYIFPQKMQSKIVVDNMLKEVVNFNFIDNIVSCRYN